MKLAMSRNNSGRKEEQRNQFVRHLALLNSPSNACERGAFPRFCYSDRHLSRAWFRVFDVMIRHRLLEIHFIS